MMNFVGRKEELKLLDNLVHKQSSSMIVVRGRRRIGKSTLIKHFGKDYTFYQFEGLAPNKHTTCQSQLNSFSRQLAQQTNLPEIVSDDWMKLFHLLWEKSNKGRIIILFDEISWMGSKDPEFLGKIKMAWDNYFSQNTKLMFVICGSASSWIEENILSNTGFLGRISQVITLDELNINEVKSFWRKENEISHISSYEIIKILSITGGVPKYLEEIDIKVPAEENIKRLCFTNGGFLTEEFDRIFSDLFISDTIIYKKIVKTLADGPKTVSEIADKIEFSKSGLLSRYLKELDLAGFIAKDYIWSLSTNKTSKIFLYRLKDNYLRFYLKYVNPNIHRIKKGDYIFKKITLLPNWQIILGLQFENMVVHNRRSIWQSLEISPDEIICDGPYIQKGTKLKSACQIDYLVQTRFNTLYLCEIKFHNDVIGMKIIEEIEKKIKRLKNPKNTSIRPVLIHANRVTEELEDSRYFYKIINFTDLLN